MSPRRPSALATISMVTLPPVVIGLFGLSNRLSPWATFAALAVAVYVTGRRVGRAAAYAALISSAMFAADLASRLPATRNPSGRVEVAAMAALLLCALAGDHRMRQVPRRALPDAPISPFDAPARPAPALTQTSGSSSATHIARSSAPTR